MSSSTQSGVYIKDNQYGWLPATVISNHNGNGNGNDSGDDKLKQVQVSVSFSPPQGGIETAVKETRTIKLKDYDDHEGMLPLQNIDEGGNMIVVPDMCDLPSLHEVSMFMCMFMCMCTCTFMFYRLVLIT